MADLGASSSRNDPVVPDGPPASVRRPVEKPTGVFLDQESPAHGLRIHNRRRVTVSGADPVVDGPFAVPSRAISALRLVQALELFELRP